jgi:TPR repeat protein
VEFDRIIPDVAIAACDKAVTADPMNPRLLYNFGRSYDRAGKYQDAAEYYGKAVQLGWPAAENALGVLTLYGRGVPLDFEKGVDLIRAASEQGNTDAIRNYTGTDLLSLFNDDDQFAGILADTLAAKGFLDTLTTVNRTWSPELSGAVEAYKKAEQISDKGVTLRVLDRLGVLAQLSNTMKRRQTDTRSEQWNQ